MEEDSEDRAGGKAKYIELVIVRKIVEWKTTGAVTIPKWWLRQAEARLNKRVEFVLMRITPERIVLEPVVDEELIHKLYPRSGGQEEQ